MTDPVPYINYFPIPAARHDDIVDSFGRIYIPGTTRKYDRAKSCCVHDGVHNCPGHCGLDIAKGRQGAIFRAPWGGVVQLDKVPSNNTAFGNQLTIVKKGTTIGFFVAHLDSFYSNVRDGMSVKYGTPLGRVGSTGQVTGPHAHVEVRLDWQNWCTSRDPYRRLIAAKNRMNA